LTAFDSRPFRVGDLVQFKRGSSSFRNLDGIDGLVLVTRLIESDVFFYGCKCFEMGEEHLWSFDQFFLVSKVDR
jgi:hypothetical protein